VITEKANSIEVLNISVGIGWRKLISKICRRDVRINWQTLSESNDAVLRKSRRQERRPSEIGWHLHVLKQKYKRVETEARESNE
jgi:hypothetical protein